ncbi:MAG: Fur family transcriptional regulator [Candidatus Thorarchaeota archaeon]
MNKEQLSSLLRKNGYKVTPQRLAICEWVLSSEDHPTAEQVFEKVSKQHPAISMTTVYHTLDMLKEIGLVSDMGFNSQPSRYDPNTSAHVNVICQRCGKIWDYQSESMQTLWNRLVSEIEVQPIGQRLDVYVICDNCKS